MCFLKRIPILLLTITTVSSQPNCLIEPCLNGGECIETSTETTCSCLDGFYGLLCEEVGYGYSFTRVISVENTLTTSYGFTVDSVALQTDVRYETSYIKPASTLNSLEDPEEFDCLCTRYGNNSGEETIDPEVLTDRIHESLTLETDLLIKHILKYQSAPDDRPSAKGIGGMGCIIIVITILLITVPDFFSLLKFLFCFKQKVVVIQAQSRLIKEK